MSQQMLPNVQDFLVRLRKIDKQGLTARDVLVLYAIICQPGMSGREVAHKLGIVDQSYISSHLHRLERAGFIEDRREARVKANPAIFHVLPAGTEFWEAIKP